MYILNIAKVSSLKLNGVDSSSNGQVINLLANDCGRFEGAIIFLPYIILGPLQALIIIAILIKLIDVSILTGLVVLAVAIPSQLLLSKAYDHTRYTYTQKWQQQMRRYLTTKTKCNHFYSLVFKSAITSKKCDKRVELINEVLSGIKIIKMYCWETPYKNIIESLRK